jgi:hypothetical protein
LQHRAHRKMSTTEEKRHREKRSKSINSMYRTLPGV